ncbi:hypothetical protein GOP47_0014681 [Adiantum capillus-veneris]|uniref:Uncharacterized protein n=1 Tax=Adiantum capillus-veneris TaxID=13818 RepID=A0A9D4UN48_ADICA|nr:hypothetical protein GOP47_0014681 [Adiantum capillus-veneris]
MLELPSLDIPLPGVRPWKDAPLQLFTIDSSSALHLAQLPHTNHNRSLSTVAFLSSGDDEYPERLAGAINDGDKAQLAATCNDEGAELVEACIHGTMSFLDLKTCHFDKLSTCAESECL